jgi:hypothetical protein
LWSGITVLETRDTTRLVKISSVKKLVIWCGITTKMEFLYGIVALLALVILVLTALVAWLYVQQSRITQSVNALTSALSAPPPTFYDAVKEFPIEETEDDMPPIEPVETLIGATAPQEDDRVSVHDDLEVEENAAAPDVAAEDDIGSKTIKQLRDALTAKGIPFNKSDKKPTLVSLLKATA